MVEVLVGIEAALQIPKPTFMELWLAVMLIVMCVFLFIILLKMGPEGRFILKMNFTQGGAIFLGMKPTGQTRFYHVKGKGRSLKSGRKRFFFLPEFVIEPEVKEGADEEEKASLIDRAKRKIFNDLLRKTSHFIGKPLYTGTISATVACTPHLSEAIKRAREYKPEEGKEDKTDMYARVGDFLEKIQELYKEGVREVDLIEPWGIDELSELVNISFTEQDIDEAWTEGYLIGLNTHVRANTVLIGVIIILGLTLLAAIWILGR